MKKMVLLTALLVSQLLHATECCPEWAFMLKQGYFYPSSGTLRQQFHNSGSRGGYFIEGALRYRCWCGLFAELNSSYFAHKGRSIVCSIATPTCPAGCTTCGDCFKFKLPALGFGLKYFFTLDQCQCLEPFLGIGMKTFFVRVYNNSPYIPQHQKINDIGGVFSAGLLCHFCTYGLAEFFIDYQCKTVEVDCCNNCSCPSACYPLNIGGVIAGIGLGLQW